MNTQWPVRPLRADAQRNRDAILLAARQAFEGEGALASLDSIALRAGVGNATLYRNFPSRDDLLAAVIDSEIASSLEKSIDSSSTSSPREVLADWLLQLAWQLRIWHDLPSRVVDALDGAVSSLNTACAPLRSRTELLLDGAKASGDATEAVTAAEVFELITIVSWGVDRFGDDKAAARRRVEIATAGIFTRM